jgi:hypothetical protein
MSDAPCTMASSLRPTRHTLCPTPLSADHVPPRVLQSRGVGVSQVHGVSRRVHVSSAVSGPPGMPRRLPVPRRLLQPKPLSLWYLQRPGSCRVHTVYYTGPVLARDQQLLVRVQCMCDGM